MGIALFILLRTVSSRIFDLFFVLLSVRFLTPQPPKVKKRPDLEIFILEFREHLTPLPPRLGDMASSCHSLDLVVSSRSEVQVLDQEYFLRAILLSTAGFFDNISNRAQVPFDYNAALVPSSSVHHVTYHFARDCCWQSAPISLNEIFGTAPWRSYRPWESAV